MVELALNYSDASLKALRITASIPGAGPWCDNSKLKDSPGQSQGSVCRTPLWSLGVLLAQGFSEGGGCSFLEAS